MNLTPKSHYMQCFFANLSFPRAFNALDNSLNVTDSPLSNQTINIWNDFSFTPGYCTWSACISSMLAFGTFNLSPKDFQNLPMSRDKSSRTSSVRALSHSSFTTFDLLVGGASTKENDKLIHDWLHEWAKWSGYYVLMGEIGLSCQLRFAPFFSQERKNYKLCLWRL